jgi:hypothetical protein
MEKPAHLLLEEPARSMRDLSRSLRRRYSLQSE